VSDFTQDIFSSRRNVGDGNTRIGQKGRIWYDSITNTIRISDGVTPGGTTIASFSGASSPTKEYPTVTDGQATVTLTTAYDIDSIDVYLNGVLLRENSDYSLSGTTLTFASNLTTGDLVTVVSDGTTGGTTPSATGGYEFTGGFADSQTYTQAQADAGTWMRFGFSASKQLTSDTPYWGNGPDVSEAPHAGTTDYQGVGLFSGSYMPSGVTQMIDFDDDTAYNQALTMAVTTAGVTENLPVTAAIGSYNFKQYKVGDFANIRVDFNVTPHVSNTTLNCALIWSTRDANDNITFTFPLTITPFFFGENTAGKKILTRPIFTAYFASQEDINARALFAIKSDNMITVEPQSTLTTVIAR